MPGESPSISWQIVAYVALTAAEVMVSIVSLEFSYTQAPKSMKSLIMSLWLFAVAFATRSRHGSTTSSRSTPRSPK
jgi:POT family proton-dependent oligopeptide transporter